MSRNIPVLCRVNAKLSRASPCREDLKQVSPAVWPCPCGNCVPWEACPGGNCARAGGSGLGPIPARGVGVLQQRCGLGGRFVLPARGSRALLTGASL